MLSAGNPYVLPSVLVAAGAYLAATLLTDASLLVRIGILALLAGVVPIVLNRLLDGGSAEEWRPESIEDAGDGDADESREV
ncbi:hypothetical protein C471_06810 [Halorubrum saccharovorum DSM 1137]|uniref:Uncharacterized protein n=1 Tax=Halorubrum saccharovorum DSM 1137 TaxID=1227484 RepID=M0E1P6_9EURY|nr:hypothetical protein [Halorubrum saccharovorum]ELZ40872.1 hypothetical protein C471_06810 [Halorubrum saccharovorum DSM 1137]